MPLSGDGPKQMPDVSVKPVIPVRPRMGIADLRVHIKERLKSASKQTSLKKLHLNVAEIGLRLKTSYETLRKFASDKDRGLDSIDDLYRLYHFFEHTRQGRRLAQSFAGSNASADRFVDAVVSPGATAPITIVGSYLVYHTAFLYPDRFTVRAMIVTEPSEGLFGFEEYLGNIDGGLTRQKNSKTKDPTEYKHQGVVTFFRNTPQFLSVTQNQTIGYRLIIGDWYDERNHIAPIITGRMMGMTTNGISYIRDVLIEHLSEEPKLAKQQARLVPFDGLTARQQGMFRDLADKRTKERFRDDALDRLERSRPLPDGDDDDDADL